jgi:Fic family protein
MNGTGDVIYTPPVGEKIIKDLLSNLEKYINDNDTIDPLVKLAVIHYQFESIHPFPDGNGRTGRILMILYLVLKGLLKMPILYLSEYINTNKTEYYKALQGIREKEDRDSLIHYILVAVEQQANKTKDKLEAVTNLIQEKKKEIDDLKLKIPGTFIDCFFDRPYCNIATIEKEKRYSWKTIKKYIDLLVKHSILEHLDTENKKEQNYTIPQYIEILLTGKFNKKSHNIKK